MEHSPDARSPHPAALPDVQKLEDFLVLVYGESERQLARKYIRCMFSGDYRKPVFLVVLEEGNIIGAASYSEELFTVDVWGISWVAVHPERRNQGLGQTLVQTCLKEITHTAGKTVTVILATYPDKTKIYDRLGFQKSSQDHAGGWLMTKILEKLP